MNTADRLEDSSALKDFSAIVIRHYENLKLVGFSEEQAFDLTRDFHNRILEDVLKTALEETDPK